ncbi:peptidylprolyl isomerase [Kiritimatiella glycovorans]|uniref:Foldase protein PrsA 2 n=1 Tax=Kiritimatiella glycovorans TaxID=1307763 RepID=A0A0G3EH61_9BACT|nr:peptidylprolyl isomerase [Kiritimatiella glycovorans]AKJ64150.1 Foldase protein PrsA 2 precursor [Kiritimatiella glycovorans]
MLRQRFNAKTIGSLCTIMLLVASCGGRDNDQGVPEEDADVSDMSNLYQQPMQPSAAQLSPDRTVMKVNGEDVAWGAFQQQIQPLMSRLPQQMGKEQRAQILQRAYQRAREQIVVQTALRQTIDEENVQVEDQAVEDAIAGIRERVPEGQSLEDMIGQRGMTMDDLRSDLRRDLRVQKLVEEKTGEVEPVTEEDLKEFYESNPQSFEQPAKVEASHILIGTETNATEEEQATKRAEAEKVKAKLDAGADFAEMAEKYSTCPSGKEGGSLGSFAKEQMVPAFSEAAFSQEIGEIGEVVETKYGYHIIKVTGKEEASKAGFDEAKEDIRRHLEAQRKQGSVQEYLQSLRDKAEVSFTEEAPAVIRPQTASGSQG